MACCTVSLRKVLPAKELVSHCLVVYGGLGLRFTGVVGESGAATHSKKNEEEQLPIAHCRRVRMRSKATNNHHHIIVYILYNNNQEVVNKF